MFRFEIPLALQRGLARAQKYAQKYARRTSTWINKVLWSPPASVPASRLSRAHPANFENTTFNASGGSGEARCTLSFLKRLWVLFVSLSMVYLLVRTHRPEVPHLRFSSFDDCLQIQRFSHDFVIGFVIVVLWSSLIWILDRPLHNAGVYSVHILSRGVFGVVPTYSAQCLRNAL